MSLFTWVCNVVVVGSKTFPAIEITQERTVTYDWLFLCALGFITGLGVSGACLGVPVISEKKAVSALTFLFEVLPLALSSAFYP
jgi:hypothetical protein